MAVRLAIRFLLFLAICAASAGCQSTPKFNSLDKKSYKLAEVQTANVGDTFISRAKGQEVMYDVWLGLPGGGWRKTPWRAQSGSVKEELVYSGKSKDTVKFMFREYRVTQNPPVPDALAYSQWVNNGDAWLAAPAFYQNVEFDLAESRTIGFRNFRFEILEATNSQMTFKVISD